MCPERPRRPEEHHDPAEDEQRREAEGDGRLAHHRVALGDRVGDVAAEAHLHPRVEAGRTRRRDDAVDAGRNERSPERRRTAARGAGDEEVRRPVGRAEVARRVAVDLAGARRDLRAGSVRRKARRAGAPGCAGSLGGRRGASGGRVARSLRQALPGARRRGSTKPGLGAGAGAIELAAHLLGSPTSAKSQRRAAGRSGGPPRAVLDRAPSRPGESRRRGPSAPTGGGWPRRRASGRRRRAWRCHTPCGSSRRRERAARRRLAGTGREIAAHLEGGWWRRQSAMTASVANTTPRRGGGTCARGGERAVDGGGRGSRGALRITARASANGYLRRHRGLTTRRGA